MCSRRFRVRGTGQELKRNGQEATAARKKRQYVDAMHDEDTIETALNTSCSQEETNGKGSVKDQDARRRRPRKSRPSRKSPRQEGSDSDYMEPDMDMSTSEEEADRMLNEKDPNWRQKRPRHTSRDSDDIQRAINESLEEADKILDLKDLADHVRSKQCSTFWHAVEGSARLLLVHIVEDEAPWIKYSVVLKADLTLTCYVAKTPVTRLGSSLCIPTAVKSKRALMEFLESIENWDSSLSSTSDSLDEDIGEAVRLLPGKSTATPTEDKAAAIHFLREQFNLLSTKKERRRYSVDFMVFSCILFTISPHAYKYICSSGNISLPNPMIIRSVCLSSGMNSQPLPQSATFLRYAAKRISDLDDEERLVTLMVDEIHIKPFFDYKGGSTTDVAPNSTEVASSVLVFYSAKPQVPIQGSLLSTIRSSIATGRRAVFCTSY
uniref:Putative p-element n=1 Tax=Ixodes ricinus TaxID=34613 RepID=A0A0K8RM91_IXORI